ncbi:hypothetical protein Emed_004361 [Eimeria media]
MPPFTCGMASLRGVKKGAAQLTASLHQHGLHASARLDAYLPLELWLLSSIPAFPPPAPSRLSNPKVAPLLQRLTHPSSLNAASNGSSQGAAAAGAALDPHLLDVQPPASAVSAVQSSSEEEALLYYGVPATTLGSSSSGGSGLGVQGEVSLVVGGSIFVFLKEGPPGRPEAYRHSLKATTEAATSTEAVAEGEEESDTSVVAVVAAEGVTGGPTRVVCLRAGRVPVAVRFETQHESKYPAINTSRGESATLLVSCGYPELLEVRVLPSLSQLLLDGEEALRASQGAAGKGSLSPIALITRKALGGAPVPAGTLAAAKTAPLSSSTREGWEAAGEARERAAESLFMQCGAVHVFSLFAFDAKLRPLLGLSGVPATWSLSPYSISQQQQQKGLDQQHRPVLELLPGSAVGGRGAEALSASAGSLAALAVPASVCCGSFMLRVSISAPAVAPQGLKKALDAQQMLQLEASLKLWREATAQQQQQRAQLPLWHDGRLEDGLLLLLSPPLRLLPPPQLSPLTAAGQNPLGQEVPTLRLFNHPAHYQRLLLQFGSPHVEAVRLFAASHKAGDTAAARGRPLLRGELLLAGSDSPSLKCLSPSQAMGRYELLLEAEPSAAAAAAATATDAACVGLPASSRDVLSASLRAPFAFTSSPYTASCPLSVREVFVSPPSVLTIQQQQQRSEELPVFLTLEASDPWMLSPWRPRPAFVDGSSSSSSMSSSPQLIARLQFVRLKSLRLVLLPTPVTVPVQRYESAAARDGQRGQGSVLSLCDSREEAMEAEGKVPSQAPQTTSAAAHIEAGKIFALRVEALGEDDLPLGPAFFSAMRLSLFAFPAEESSNIAGASRNGISGVSATRGRVFLKTALSRQQQQQQQRPQQHVEQRHALPEGVSAVRPLMSASAPLAVASYDPAAAAAGAGEFAAPEGWQQLGSITEDEADCAHFFVAAADMKGAFVLEAEAYTAAPAGMGAAAGGGAAAVVPVTSRLTVEIHPPLELTPSHLVMLPGGHSFELTLQGGPEDAQADSSSSSVSRKIKGDYERRFSVEDQRVAQLSEESPGLLLTGEEGETRVSVSLQHGRAGGRLTQAAMRVVVALPQSAAIISGLRRGGGRTSASSRSKELPERQAREAQQASLLPTQASRLGYNRAAAAAAAAVAASADDEGSIEVYANHVVPLQGALFDAGGRRFSHPHLLMPTGPLGGDGDGKHGEATERQAKFGALGSLPPFDAVACVFDWEVRSGDGAPRALLLSPLEVPLAEPPVHSAATAAVVAATPDEEETVGGLPLWSPANGGRRRLRSRGLAAVLLVGVEAGEARLSLTVSCFRHNKQVASVSAAEVSVRVLDSFAREALAAAASPGLTGIVSAVSSLAAPVLPPLLATEGVYLLPCCSVELLQLEGSTPSSATAVAGLDAAGAHEQASLEACCAAAAAKVTDLKDGDDEAAAAAAAEAATAAAACCEGVGGADCCEWSSTAATAAEAAAYAAFVLSGSKGFIASPLAGMHGVLRLSGANAGGQQRLQQVNLQGANTEVPPQSHPGSSSVKDRGSSSLLLGFETARVESIQLSPLVHNLNIGASRDLQLALRDARGRLLLSPSSLELEVASSHPSVVSVDVVTGSEGPLGPPAVRLRAHRRGCASVSVSLLSPATGLQASLQQQQEPMSLVTSGLRVCSDSAEALPPHLPPYVLPGATVSILGGYRVPSLLLPATAALKVQLAFRASPVVAAYNSWTGASNDEAEGDAAAKAAAGAGTGMMPCLSQEQAAALLPQLSPQLRPEIERLVTVALQHMPSGAPQAEEPYFSPRVFVKSLHVQQLQQDRATLAAAAAAATASENAAGASLCSAHAAGGTFEDGSTLIVADVHILDLAAAAATAVSQQMAGSQQAATAAIGALGTLDSLPAEWRVDGVLVLLQQLWRGLEKEWRAALPAAASLLQDDATLEATTSSVCRRRCPSWSFPLASFIAWDRGFGAVSLVSSSSSVSSSVGTRRSSRGSFSCKEFGGVRSSDPSALTLIGAGSCGAGDGKAFGLVAIATKETKEVQLLQHGASLAAFEILGPNALSAAARSRFRLLASVACGELQEQLQQQHQHEEERWVAVEDLSLPRCRGTGGSQRGPMTIAFRAEALRKPLSLADGRRGLVEERRARWEELPFVTPLFSSHLSVSCRLVDPLLSRLFSVSSAAVPSDTRNMQGGGGLSVANGKAEQGAGGPSARPLCALTEKPRVSVQDVLPFLRSSLVSRPTARAEELVWGPLQGRAPPHTSGDCKGVVEALTKPAGTSLSLVITLSRNTSPLTRLQPQQQQQQLQQLMLPQQEVFLAHCMHWQGALPLRLLYDKTIMTEFAEPAASHSSPDATVRIKPAKQILRFVPASGGNSGKSRNKGLLVALPHFKGSSSAKWPLELHVFPLLTPANPEVRVSNDSFSVDVERQGPLLTIRLSPALKTSSSNSPAAAAGDSNGTLMEWTAPEHTEVFVEGEADTVSGGRRLRVVLDGSGVRSMPTFEPQEEEATFTETAAPPLLVCTLFACVGALACWLFCRSAAAAGEGVPSQPAVGEGAGGAGGGKDSGAAMKRSDGSAGGGAPYLTRSGRAAGGGLGGPQPRRYDAPFTPVRQSATEPPSYTLQPNGAWQISEPVVAGAGGLSQGLSNSKASTRFYEG